MESKTLWRRVYSLTALATFLGCACGSFIRRLSALHTWVRVSMRVWVWVSLWVRVWVRVRVRMRARVRVRVTVTV